MQANHTRTNPLGVGLTVALSLLLTEASAQQITDSTFYRGPGAAADDEEVVELSPFEVDASQDQGYRATNTLAGSRINTNLKDVAGSITVVTKEFLNDIAAADINDVLAYTANTEGTRDYTASVSSLGRPTDDNAANPFGANRVRGLQAADTTRDFFYTINNYIGFDTYNLDQVTINRGPNSVLAGLGSPAGIVNYSPQGASLSRNHTLLSVRVGSNSDFRTVANTNIVAKEDELAFRIAGVWADRGFKQKPSKREDTRIYFATTYKPTKLTTVKASYELAHVEANNPNSITPEDDITSWLAAGSPSYDNVADGGTIPDGLGGGGGRPTVVYNANGSVEGFLDLSNMAQFFQPNDPDVDLYTRLRMNNNDYIDLFGTNLNPSSDDRSFEALNLSLDQEVTKDLYLNFAWVSEKVDVSRINLFRSEYASYLVDPNVRLPDGSTNPHYGETYMQYRGLDNLGDEYNTNDVLRGTATYDLDFTESNPWLGRYRITGFLETRETETDRRQFNARVPNVDDQDYQNRFYLGGSATSHPTATPMTPDLVSGVMPIAGSVLPQGGTTLNGAYGLKSDRKRLEKVATSAVAVQAYLWDDKIVGLYGYRKDTNKGTEVGGENSDTYQDISDFAGLYPAADKVEQSTSTYGVVVHPLEWLSLHYNKSDNFVPSAGKIQLDGTPTSLPTGGGEDWGFSLSLMENRLNVKMNWYDLSAKGADANDIIFPLNEWVIPFAELTLYPAIASSAAFQADHPGFVYQKAMEPSLILGDPRLNGAYSADRVSKGIELELTYNITNNWRLMGNISKQKAKASGIATALTPFIEERRDYWESSGLYDYETPPGVGWGPPISGENIYNFLILGDFIHYQSLDGKPSDALAKWHASVLTNYSVTEGPLAGFNFGGGARYIEAATIGNPVIKNSEGQVIALDLDHPYTNDSKISVDAWIGYKTKIFDDRYNWSLQLNVRDLLQDGEFQPIRTNSDGTESVFRIVQPRSFVLTSTLEF